MESHRFVRPILVLVLLVFSVPLVQAGDLPRYSTGGGVIHGGRVGFAKAGMDTINLMATHRDPTNEQGEPFYYGDFENAGGGSDWNGWTHLDLSQGTATHWQVSDYQQTGGNLAAWCGNINFPACDFLDMEGGYGNGWQDVLEFRQTVPHPEQPTTVTVTATLQHDSEVGYDFTSLSYRFGGQSFIDLDSWDGTGIVAAQGSVMYLPADYLGGTDIAVYFRFESDVAGSDEDCVYPSVGACQVDDINVHLVNGVFTGDFFEDFEDSGDPADFGIWEVFSPDLVGDFAHLWEGLRSQDPCALNHSPQVAFIDNGLLVPGTGGSPCINWCYGPGGFIVTTTGGMAGPDSWIHNAVDSPVMAWPDPQTGSGPDDDGITLAFSVYRHEDLSANSPGIFYNYYVRSADTDGSAGNGVQDINDQEWRDRDLIYYGGPEYFRHIDEVTDLMNPGRDEVQVRLSVAELGWAWSWTGNDGYPAPYFDNVTVKVFPYEGPGMSARELDLAQDNFPARGSIDTGDLGSHSVRFDAAINISSPSHLRNDPGDSLIVHILPVRAGAELVEDPKLNYIMDPNPAFDPYRAGWPAVGSVSGWPAVGVPPGDPRWCFDLPDTGFLFPGDVLHYYIEATDALGGTGGTDPRTALIPADTTGFSSGFGDPMGYNSSFTMHALPSILSDGFGGFDQPGILFINDFADGGGENEWYTALNNIGLQLHKDYDVYYVNAPSSGAGNGIGGRANDFMLSDYSDILYTCGNLGAITLSNGDYQRDAGDDVGILAFWLDQGRKDIFLTGDGLASDLAQSGNGTRNFLETYLGLTVVTDDLGSSIGNQATPRVEVISGNPIFLPSSSLQAWVAFGGCPGINAFDGINPYGTGQRMAEFHDPLGVGYDFSAVTLNILDPGPDQSRVISMPYDLMYVFTDPTAAGHPLPGRAQLLRDVLEYFNISGDAGSVTGTDNVPGYTFATSQYPNPFNPSTTIKYSMPRAGHLQLSIYNVRGQLVKTLIDGHVLVGDGQIFWDGADNLGTAAASGVYFYEARAAGEVIIGKMTLLK